MSTSLTGILLKLASEWCLKNGYPPFIKSLVENEDIKNDEYVSIFSQMEDYGEVSCVGLTTGQQIQSDVHVPHGRKHHGRKRRPRPN